MAVKVNELAVKKAKELINKGKVIKDEKDDWSEHQPSTDTQNQYLEEHDVKEFGHWFLGIKTDQETDNKTTYEFPYGDFQKVHRGGVIAAKVRAGQYKHKDIEDAANQLLSMIDSR